MYGYIYLTTNLINGRKYIGQKKSSTFLGTNYLGSGKLIVQAVNKYGYDNFKVEMLCECSSKEDLDSKEREFIKEYNAVDSREFYNIAFGGQSQAHRLSQEERKRLSEIAKTRIGEKNPFYGKHLSEESIRIRVESFKETIKDPEIRKTLGRNRGTIIINNGTQEKHILPDQEVPEGYSLGRLSFSESHRRNISITHKKENLSEETKRRMSEGQKRSRTHKERRDQQLKYIESLSKDEFKERYVTPRLRENLSEETRKRMSDKSSERNLGRIWINNGTDNKFIYEKDLDKYEGYVVGRIQNNSEHKGTFFITDGICNRLIKEGQEIPEGWRKGMTRH